MRPTFAALVLAAALLGCATPAPSPYGPAVRAGADGYTETRIESDRYRIAYHLAAGPAARASDLALLRASELTLAQGYEWFAVTQRGYEGGYRERSGPRVSFGIGGASFGSHTAIGVGTGVGFDVGGQGNQRGEATATIEFRMGRGPKPPTPDVYDARDVDRSIRPRA